MIRIETEGAVRTLFTANPPRNMMTSATAAELDAAVADALADPAVRVLILTGGEAGVFIRHYDVAEIALMLDAVEAGHVTGPAPRAEVPVYRLIDRLLSADKPVIAAINGIAMGGGLETALACHLRIAEAGPHVIGLPETRIGIIPGAGGLQLLARAIGLARATELVLRGRVLTPDEAAALGVVHEVAPSALARARALADELAALPAAALAQVLGMARRVAAGEPLADGLQSAAAAFLETLKPVSGARDGIARYDAAGGNILA
ncbi:MAG: enoyl-CoA hydratase/isomerase family protein [Sandaracinobacter sp.]